MEQNNEIVLPEGASFKRKYTYQPYSYHRIVNILKDADLYLQPIVWYKCGRYDGYVQRYNVRMIETDEIIRENVSLNNLREILARLDYPLQAPETRNQGAQHFMEIVHHLQK